MSKLYKSYKNLKQNNPNKIYLFKSGMFYISLQEDAEKLSDIFGFKITNLNEEVTKVGFPQLCLLRKAYSRSISIKEIYSFLKGICIKDYKYNTVFR